MGLIEDALKSRVNTHRDGIRRLSACKELVDLAIDIADKHWCINEDYDKGKRRRIIDVGGTTKLTLFLSSIDSLKYDIMDILEAFLDADFVVDYEYHYKGSSKQWTFKTPFTWKSIDGKTYKHSFVLDVDYTSSDRCRVVETGKTVTTESKETILVCED